MDMSKEIESAVRSRLGTAGLRKLPPAVIARLVEIVAGDMTVALEKSLVKRTSPKAVARVFAECVMAGAVGDYKGAVSPFGQLCPANACEPRILIGEHSETGDELLKKDLSR
jgi:hypothetical protein